MAQRDKPTFLTVCNFLNLQIYHLYPTIHTTLSPGKNYFYMLGIR